MSLNCNSIPGKTHHLDCVIRHDSPVMIAFCEKKLNPTIPDSEILIGYTIYIVAIEPALLGVVFYLQFLITPT